MLKLKHKLELKALDKIRFQIINNMFSKFSHFKRNLTEGHAKYYLPAHLKILKNVLKINQI
jgi:hypothetical protein